MKPSKRNGKTAREAEKAGRSTTKAPATVRMHPAAADGPARFRRTSRLMVTRSAGGLDPSDPQTGLLSQTARLEESGTSVFTRSALLWGGALVFLAIGWASVTKLEEFATAPGKVVPDGSVKVVQHLEGGIVDAIFVEDGDRVKKGEVLLQLRSQAFLAELRRLEAQEAALNLRAERLFAFVTGRQLRPINASVEARYGKLYEEEIAVLNLQEKTRSLQRSVLQQQIGQKQSELKVIKANEDGLRDQFKSLEEAYALRTSGNEKGVVSRSLFLQTQREHARLRGEIAEAEAKYARAQRELAEAKAKLAEHDARVRSEAMDERGKVLAELAQIREKRADLADRVRRLKIRAPATGIVKGLTVKTVGGVITSDGSPLMEIVPVDRRLLVEARASTRDVGHLKVGQTARIKVDTFDYARYGAIAGTVKEISATNFIDKDGRPYFRIMIALDKTHVGPVPANRALSPGMTVSVEMITGSKSLMAYLLKPVYVAASEGLRER